MRAERGSCVSDRTGLVAEPVPGPGPWPLSELVPRMRALAHHPAGPLRVAGAGYGPAAAAVERARLACIAEGVERYAAALPRPGDLWASRTELLARDLPHLTPLQLGVRIEADQPVSWLRARNGTLVPRNAALGHGNPWLDPAEGVYPHGSTGLAAGPEQSSWESLVESGAAEVVERDVLARAWGGTGALPRATLPAHLAAHCRAAQLAASAHLLPAGDDAVVAFVVLRGRGLLGAGAAYRPVAVDGLTKAFVEAVVSLAQAAEIADPVDGPRTCAEVGLGPWRPPGEWLAPQREDVVDIVGHLPVLLDRRVQDAVWARLANQPTAPDSAGAGPSATRLLHGAVAVDLTGTDCAGHRVCRVLAPDARPVLPWAHSLGDLPCPLI